MDQVEGGVGKGQPLQRLTPELSPVAQPQSLPILLCLLQHRLRDVHADAAKAATSEGQRMIADAAAGVENASLGVGFQMSEHAVEDVGVEAVLQRVAAIDGLPTFVDLAGLKRLFEQHG